ncbi:MAG: hypothetical protein PHO41_06060 [Eubacteriales bacterium]|nr:hypothetical protein [Eubacteriales bacterium]
MGTTTIVYDELQALEPAVLLMLEKTDLYQRFIRERKKLEKLAWQEREATGKMNSASVLIQSKRVDTIGAQVLKEIQSIRVLRQKTE